MLTQDHTTSKWPSWICAQTVTSRAVLSTLCTLVLLTTSPAPGGKGGEGRDRKTSSRCLGASPLPFSALWPDCFATPCYRKARGEGNKDRCPVLHLSLSLTTGPLPPPNSALIPCSRHCSPGQEGSYPALDSLRYKMTLVIFIKLLSLTNLRGDSSVHSGSCFSVFITSTGLHLKVHYTQKKTDVTVSQKRTCSKPDLQANN